jgi:hypothetical protein
MNCLKIMAVLLLLSSTAKSQELFVFSEPASNMPSKAIGIRLTNEGMSQSGFVNRTIPEVMIGFNKNLMGHAQAFFSDMDGRYRLEGGIMLEVTSADQHLQESVLVSDRLIRRISI